MSIFDSYLYVDYENVQDLKVDKINKATKILKEKIFLSILRIQDTTHSLVT